MSHAAMPWLLIDVMECYPGVHILVLARAL